MNVISHSKNSYLQKYFNVLVLGLFIELFYALWRLLELKGLNFYNPIFLIHLVSIKAYLVKSETSRSNRRFIGFIFL